MDAHLDFLKIYSLQDKVLDIFTKCDNSFIHETTAFDWTAVLDIAGKKTPFERDYLLYRIQIFPLEMIDSLAVIKNEYADACKENIHVILRELESII